MDNRLPLMEEFFELGSKLRRLADEYRSAMAPLQERRKAIESALVGACGSDCESCSAPSLRVKDSRTIN